MTRDMFRPCLAAFFLAALPLAFLNGTLDGLWRDTAAAFGAGRAS